MRPRKQPEQKGRHGGSFSTTHWSLVLAAGRKESDSSRDALAILCEKYWPPLYAAIRKRGYPPEQAEDLAQEFFCRVLEKGYIRHAQPERGRFRAFILTALKRFLSNERDRACAQKRGGGQLPFSLDCASGENTYQTQAFHSLTPEKLYEKQWAMSMLGHVLAELRSEYASTGRESVFEALKGFLTGESPRRSYGELAESLGMTEGAVKVAVHRLRKRYSHLLHKEVAQTVADPKDTAVEIRYLLDALRG